MCKKSQDLHQNNSHALKEVIKRVVAIKQKLEKSKKGDKPNNAEYFFLMNEDVLN